MVDIEKLILNPKKHFKDPEEVLRLKNLNTDQKIKILKSWLYDSRQLQVAEEENMQGPNDNVLNRVLNALRELGADALF
jgi:hypothetical protein